MAARYARAGGGNWSADSTWSTTSGGAADTVAPTAADDVFLDAASGAVTIDSGAVCRSLDCNGYTGTLTHTAAVALTIGDGTSGAGNRALRLVAGMTYTLGNANTSSLVFVSSSGLSQTIATGGKTTGSFSINTGSFQLLDASTIGATGGIVKNSGTFDTNGQTCSWGSFTSTTSSPRTLTMGASNITLTGTGTVWNTGTITNMTVTANTATITASGAGVTFTSAGLNFNGATVVLSGSGQANLSASGGTFGALTRTGTAVKTDTFLISSGNFTVTGAFTINSNSDINRVLIQSSAVGSSRTITAGSVVITNTVDFMDITGAGAATWTVAGTGATALGDCGGNSGITFTTPATQTHTASAGGNWSDVTKWTSRVPLPQDNVVVDVNTTGTLTADMPRMGKDIDFTGFTGTLALTSTSNTALGSWTLVSGMTLSSTQGFTFAGRGAHTVTMAGKSLGGSTTFSPFGGSYSLQDAFSGSGSASTLGIAGGTVNTNNFNITYALVSTSTGATFNMGTSTISLTSTAAGNIWIGNATLDAGSATIAFTNASTVTRTFAGAAKTYGTLTYTVANSPGSLTISGNNTFNTLNIGSGRILTMTSGTTNTVTNFNVNGAANGYVYMPGVSGHYISAPDSAALSITGDVDYRILCALDDWTPAGAVPLFAKRTGTGNQRSWYIRIDATTGLLRLALSLDGTAETTAVSSVAPTVSDGSAIWLRATWSASDGRVQFFTAPSSIANPVAADFTQLGTDATIAIASIFDSTALVEVGSTDSGTAASFNLAVGKFYRAQIRNGIDGTTAFDADFTTKPVGVNTMSESSGNTAAFTGGYLRLPGVAGNSASAPDSAAVSITGDLDLRIAAAMDDWTPAAEQAFIGKRLTTGNQRSFYFAVSTNGRPILYLSTDGTTEVTKSATAAPVVSDGALLLVRATFDADNGAGGYDVTYYTKTSTAATAPADTLSDSGWTQLGTTVTTATPITLFDSTSLLEIGSQGNGTGIFGGKIYAAVVKNGINGTTAFNADFTTPTAEKRSFTESSTNAATVSLNGGVTINGTLAQAGDGRVSLISSTGGSAATMTSTNQQGVNYLSIQDSTVDASPKWFAGLNSVNVSGNTNWLFTNQTGLSDTRYSSQAALNLIYGSGSERYTLQEIANMYHGTGQHTLSFQEVLNIRRGVQPHAGSEQQALYENLKTPLGLSGRDTQYSVQQLLNMAYTNGLQISAVFK